MEMSELNELMGKLIDLGEKELLKDKCEVILKIMRHYEVSFQDLYMHNLVGKLERLASE